MDIRNFFGSGAKAKPKPVSTKPVISETKKETIPAKKPPSTPKESTDHKKTKKTGKTPASESKSKPNGTKKRESIIIDSGSDFEEYAKSKESSSSRSGKKTEIDGKKPRDKNGNIKDSTNESSPEVKSSKKSHKKQKLSEEIEISSSPEVKKPTKKQKKSGRVDIFSSPEVKKADKKKKAVIESSEEDDEEIIQPKPKKKKGGSSRKGVIFDSDSETEDPLPKKKRARKKKEYQFSSDEESITDAFQRIQSQSKPKVAPSSSKIPSPPKKQISACDFFGTSTVQRVGSKTPVGKRKADSSPVTTADIADAMEFHDDDDFEETLRQLDESEKPKPKKAKLDDEEAKPKSLSSKLAQKVKDGYCVKDTPEKPSSSKHRHSPAKSTSTSPAKMTAEILPAKASPPKLSPTKASPQKLSPAKTSPRKTSPVKTSPPKASPGKKTSPSEKPDLKKSNAGYRSFLTREGPRSLGSKEVPQGEDNCMEGLTFVITGILESFERDEAKTMIERYGGKVTGSLSKKTSYMLTGRDAGESKLSKAKSFNTKIIDEDDLLCLLRTLPGKKSKYQIAAEKESKSTPARTTSFGSSSRTPGGKTPVSTNTSTASPMIKSLPTTPKIMSTPSTPRTPVSVGSSPQTPSKGVSGGDPTLLWVDKYKPTSLKQIIGQQGDKSNARKLLNWLNTWHKNVASGKKPAFNRFSDDGGGHRAALLSGPPGVGKTTTAHLVCREAGFDFVELNASDTRSKKSLQHEVSESLNNHSLTDYFGESSKVVDGKSHCLVMDEVDGMAGNEDRGGVAELVGLIKNTKIPIICMCNDRNHQKIRTLANYCFDLRFQRPRVEQIKSAMMSLSFKEGIKIPPPALNEIILASNQDVRQVIHNLSMWSATDKNLTFDQLKSDASKAKKDIKLGPFDVVRKVFTSGEETAHMTLNDKSDLFFHDYSFGPLFVQENYISVQPVAARGDTKKHLQLLSRAADSIATGDLVDRLVRSRQQWGMLPLQAIYASVIPGDTMRGYLGGQIQFPSWLGKNSSRGKTDRILQELKSHMKLKISGDKKALNMEYLPHLRHTLTEPLVQQGSDGVPEVIKRLDEYDLIKEDFDSILEISQWPNSKDIMGKVESKTKAAFTRAYNKEVHMTPYATGNVAKKGRGRGAAASDEMGPGEEGEPSQVGESDEEEEDMSVDTMIKKKKAASAKGKGRGAGDASSSKVKGRGAGAASSSKGKGRGKGRGKGK